MITGLELMVNEDIFDLYEFILDDAYEKLDKKLPVPLKLLEQQVQVIDKFLVPGYENILAKAVLSTAWMAQLQVSEYSSRLVEDFSASQDHNLGADSIIVQEDGITFEFLTHKNSRHRKERFRLERCTNARL